MFEKDIITEWDRGKDGGSDAAWDHQNLEQLGEGNIAVGHVRYSTTGGKNHNNIQPVVIRHMKGNLALCHNGNLVNAGELRMRHELSGLMCFRVYLFFPSGFNCPGSVRSSGQASRRALSRAGEPRGSGCGDGSTGFGNRRGAGIRAGEWYPLWSWIPEEQVYGMWSSKNSANRECSREMGGYTASFPIDTLALTHNLWYNPSRCGKRTKRQQGKTKKQGTNHENSLIRTDRPHGYGSAA